MKVESTICQVSDSFVNGTNDQNRILPIAVKEIGEKYKKDFELNVNNTSIIDMLINNASSDLLSKATCLL